ncbi:DUF1641 domain-containing protein [Alicyclobacillus macrosporangiidus]|jgi:uncharacterized protein YjgD (DUF1641 family)|uniref:Uncharacterized conserved protein YjgD, DUF1641 family n=1 Tax=Alicyclobacillus macrosporangiidus TaxID=392015 RepID=A0A1I7K243_9BACL|nr:DUF1641 domain-containing protein [Alicyclobacillus macrosporangiidus]SFU91462.1 Uncharacterized conserved protein YjgD, DUF1641 family [Alicyclobacillus macrosporangiidus]
MAKPVTTWIRPEPTEADLQSERLEGLLHAAADHADAVEEGLRLLQAMHDREVLQLLTALFVRGDRVLGILAEQLDGPGTATGLRNLSLAVSSLGQLDSDALARVLGGVAGGLEAAAHAAAAARPAGVFELLRQLKDPDVAAGLAAGLALLKAVGRALRNPAQGPGETG